MLGSPHAGEVQHLIWVRDLHPAAVTWGEAPTSVLLSMLTHAGRIAAGSCAAAHHVALCSYNCFLQLLCILLPIQKFRGLADLNLQINYFRAVLGPCSVGCRQ